MIEIYEATKIMNAKTAIVLLVFSLIHSDL